MGLTLGCDPDWIMAVIAFETGRSFSPSIRNAAGSGATGLVQFLVSTAAMLGTTTDALAAMTAFGQLAWVEKYFRPPGRPFQHGRYKTLEDLYCWVLWPAAVGKPADYVLFDQKDTKHPKRFIQNAGLDFDKNGKITKFEVAARVRAILAEGMLPGNLEGTGVSAVTRVLSAKATPVVKSKKAVA